MFDQTFVNTHAHTQKSWTVLVSIAGQSLLVGALLLAPILHPEILHPRLDVPIFVHLQAMPKAVKTQAAPVVSTGRTAAPRAFVAPSKIPEGVRRIVDPNMAEPESFAMIGPVSGVGQGADIFSNFGQPAIPTTPPEPPKAAAPKPTPPAGPVQVSQGVQAARLVYGPKPPYPPLAKAARVQGTVRIQAIVAADGVIGRLKAMSGPPLLINAALEAVVRWKYQPTLLSGKAVEVITEIDVVFTLSQ